jgi:DNA excision repair protein ERCC-2
LDERFMQKQYQDLFPREWYPFDVVNCEKMKELLAEFWQE